MFYEHKKKTVTVLTYIVTPSCNNVISMKSIV